MPGPWLDSPAQTTAESDAQCWAPCPSESTELFSLNWHHSSGSKAWTESCGQSHLDTNGLTNDSEQEKD